jgi:hypothetical protein
VNARRTTWVVLAFAVACTYAGGCDLAGAVSHKLVGPPPVPAMYKPANEPMLVLVENYRNPSATMLDAARLSMLIADEFRRHDIAPLVNPQKLEALRTDPGFEKMTIPAVGRNTGAKQVLYVNVRRFGVEGTVGGEMMKGTAEMTVRVVDAATGDNRWPIDAAGHPVNVSTPWVRLGQGADEVALRDQMSRTAAVAIGKMFRKYSTEFDDAEQAVQ